MMSFLFLFFPFKPVDTHPSMRILNAGDIPLALLILKDFRGMCMEGCNLLFIIKAKLVQIHRMQHIGFMLVGTLYIPLIPDSIPCAHEKVK